jgi:TRAP-type mannitol/chloroaromatic compound transport system permease large subunit
MEIIPILFIVMICAALLLGYPVAFTLAGGSLLFAFIASWFGYFDIGLLKTIPIRIFGIMNNQTLLAVPLFFST